MYICTCTYTCIYHIFQVVVTKVTADYDRWTLLKSNEPLITLLQARLRGRQCRKAFLSRMDYLKAHEQQAVTLQVQNILGLCIHCTYMYKLVYSNFKSTNPVAYSMELCPMEHNEPGAIVCFNVTQKVCNNQ